MSDAYCLQMSYKQDVKYGGSLMSSKIAEKIYFYKKYHLKLLNFIGKKGNRCKEYR